MVLIRTLQKNNKLDGTPRLSILLRLRVTEGKALGKSVRINEGDSYACRMRMEI